jgi:hypothetical protein
MTIGAKSGPPALGDDLSKFPPFLPDSTFLLDPLGSLSGQPVQRDHG